MAKLIYPLFLLYCLFLLACEETNVSKKASAAQQEKLVYDTNKIAIIPLGKIGLYIFEKATPTQLTNDDLEIIDKLLKESINKNNGIQDSTNRFSDYIDLRKYRLQYMPVIDSAGNKKVYISGFCYTEEDTSFDYWRKDLVAVNDGGSCFFHLTINLSKKEYEHLFINGYA